jgi:hypothetical protein
MIDILLRGMHNKHPAGKPRPYAGGTADAEQ